MSDNKIPYTPFPANGYFGPEYFCDRNDELHQLIQNLKGGHSITLTSMRRIGKTGLIRHVQHTLNKDWICIYVDILATENMSQLLNMLASAIARVFSERSGVGRKIWNALKQLRPVVGFDAITGEPNLSFDLDESESRKHIESLLDLLDKQEKRVLVAIDEFQQILEYPEKNVDAWLRTKIQHLRNVVFIFSGSRQHLMTELFASPSRPFFRSTAFLHLEKIPHNVYREFIVEMFESRKKTISLRDVDDMLNWTRRHTYYVQVLCNRLFINSGRKVKEASWRSVAQKLLKEQEMFFFTYRDMLTKSQWQLLKAVAREEELFAPTAKGFIISSGLGSSANILRALDSLITKELVCEFRSDTGERCYCVYDVFFMRWVQEILQ